MKKTVYGYYVYRCYDAVGRLLYVGIQDRAYLRMDKYRQLLSCGKLVSWARTEYIGKTERAANERLELILLAEQPEYNYREKTMELGVRDRYIEAQMARGRARVLETETIGTFRVLRSSGVKVYTFDPPLIVPKKDRVERYRLIDERIKIEEGLTHQP